MMFFFKYHIIDRIKHLVSFSGGKDSSAMLIRMVEEERPIDDIVFVTQKNISRLKDLLIKVKP